MSDRQVTLAGLADPENRSTAPEAIYERVAPVVRRTVAFYAPTDPEREDMAQDALVAILRNRATVSTSEQLEAWAARVTFNTMCSAFRRRKLRRWLPLESLRGADPEAPVSDFEAREFLERTLGLLDQLPVKEGTVLRLELLANVSHAEIARRCGCSKRTVRRRLKSARQRFMNLSHADATLKSRFRATK